MLCNVIIIGVNHKHGVWRRYGWISRTILHIFHCFTPRVYIKASSDFAFCAHALAQNAVQSVKSKLPFSEFLYYTNPLPIHNCDAIMDRCADGCTYESTTSALMCVCVGRLHRKGIYVRFHDALTFHVRLRYRFPPWIHRDRGRGLWPITADLPHASEAKSRSAETNQGLFISYITLAEVVGGKVEWNGGTEWRPSCTPHGAVAVYSSQSNYSPGLIFHLLAC